MCYVSNYYHLARALGLDWWLLLHPNQEGCDTCPLHANLDELEEILMDRGEKFGVPTPTMLRIDGSYGPSSVSVVCVLGESAGGMELDALLNTWHALKSWPQVRDLTVAVAPALFEQRGEEEHEAVMFVRRNATYDHSLSSIVRISMGPVRADCRIVRVGLNNTGHSTC